MVEIRMIERKKEVARELADMFLSGDLSDTKQLSYTMRKLYTKHALLFRWKERKTRSERPFIYLASKYLFGIELDEFKPFREIRKIDDLYRETKRQNEIANLLASSDWAENKLVILPKLLKLNLDYIDLNLILEREGVEYYKSVVREYTPRSRKAVSIITNLMQGYVSNKILEKIFDRNITNRTEKEEFKMRLANLYLIPAPSDQDVYHRCMPLNSHIDFNSFGLGRILNIPETIV